MPLLAKFAMRGRSQAAIAVTVPALLSMLLPALGILSSAALALITMRSGGKEGLQVMGFSGIACILFTYVLFGSVNPSVILLLMLLWMPIWNLGILLRVSRSLSLTVQAALGFGVLLIVILHWGLNGVSSQWLLVLESLAAELTQSGLLSPHEKQQLIQTLTLWTVSILVIGFYIQLLLSLFLARNWQAQLYNPGGFATEFKSLRIHRSIAIATLLLMLMWLQGASIPLWTRDITILLVPVWVVQGLAVIHGTASQFGIHTNWLIAMYALSMVATPPAVVLMVLIGLVDVIVDFRGRFPSKPSSDQ